MSKLWSLLTDADYRFMALRNHGFYHNMSDEKYLKRLYRIKMGKELDLENPQTFNEKLQWLKIHDRKPIYTTMVDKYEAKKYVASIIGEEYIIPTLGVWERFDDIDFDALPNQFVLKCTHDSGGLVICRDKSKLDLAAARKKINKCLKRNYYWVGREWPYKNVKPRIIAEKYMEDTDTKELRDYKFFTFNGVVKALMLNQNRGKNTKADYFDADFNHLNLKWGYPNAETMPKCPRSFERMRAAAEKLSESISELRVDFYEVDGKTYFGELTFYDGMGMEAFDPPEWDKTFGEWITLPNESGGGGVPVDK